MLPRQELAIFLRPVPLPSAGKPEMSAHPSPQFYHSLVAAPLRAWLKLPDSEDRVPAPSLVTDYWAFTLPNCAAFEVGNGLLGGKRDGQLESFRYVAPSALTIIKH